MGLPPNFLKEYNSSRNFDFMIALRYFPATETENNGLSEHQDGNCITLVFQDEIGGLEILKNDNWIQIEPSEGDIIVNLGDMIQVKFSISPLSEHILTKIASEFIISLLGC